jgi:hypothetical protein
MAEKRHKICFEEREFKGSRFRCLLVTHGPNPEVVAFLNSLVHPFAKVDEDPKFMPVGFSKSEEARLGETPGFLTDEHRHVVTDWWLAVPEKANTPNWDLVCTCTVEGRRGLVIVEAKAHAGELKPNDCCGARDEDNRQRIKDAVGDASKALGEGWRLSVDSHYQLSNRFAWAWKVASLGVPVVLVYLGFLNANEMGQPFASHEGWERCLLAYADGTVPRSVWNSSQIQVNGIPVIPLIRSADVNITIA